MIVAVSSVLNEAPILRDTTMHLLNQGVDWVVISDGRSTDGTRELICELPQTTMLTQYGPFRQDEEMTRLAQYARKMGADWVIPFDADEYWCGIADLSVVPSGYSRVYAPVFHHIDTDRRWATPKLPKVAFRPAADMTVEWGNHNVHGLDGDSLTGPLVVRELQYRDYDHFLSKIERAAQLYAESEFPAEYGSHLRRLVGLTDMERAAEWATMQLVPTVHDPIPAYR